MFKLLLIASTLAIVITLGKLLDNQPTTSINKFTSSDKPIALVKYKDTIYHCQGIIRTKCGHTIHCGDMSVHCVDDIQVEYLK